ncbi:chemotaxis protein methyltransferase CheR [Actinokineospora cianjurensis]|uniref:protein-glutamate O-methyltransferase n=2 Tax=Actinokineospora cianjurensis TaxID=585224 RepID=A0A421AV68_9PSEU|nr:chemotaxis protein methyltransferase CheR [Actinokineospora cianjurensis]
MEMTPALFGFVADLVYREAGMVLRPGKEYLVESRLKPVAKATGHDTVGSLANALRTSNAALRTQVVEALTINETSWFRDREPFTALTDTILPDVLAKSTRPVRIWSAACSSGQEPYSIAITLEKALPAGRGYQIMGSDLSEEMLRRSRAGRFNQLEVNRGLPATDLVTYFQRAGAEWEAVPRIRQNLSFQRVNLCAPLPPMPKFDVVFLRNVLIYFEPETKRAVLDRVRQVLNPGGWLLLGAAESTVGIDSVFERVPVGRTAIYRAPARDRQLVKEVTQC